MELRQLRYFVAVSDLASFTRASEELSIAQPALSTQIAKLEFELGVRVLDRANGKVSLTEPGRVLLDRARRVVGGADDLKRIASQLARGVNDSLDVGYTPLFPFDGLVRTFEIVRAHRPEARIDLHVGSSEEQAAAVLDGSLDCAFVRVAAASATDLEVIPVLSQRLVFALPSSHRLAGKGSLRLKDLADEDWVIVSRAASDGCYDNFAAACRALGFSPRIKQEASDARVVMGLVAAGLGVAVVPQSVRRHRFHGVSFASITRSTHRIQLGLVVRRDTTSPLLQSLVHELPQQIAVNQ